MINDIEKVYYSEETLKGVVERLGKQISEDYKDKNLLLVSVLKGSVLFMADLMRAITVPCAIDFMCVSSYANKTESSGVVKIVKDLDINLEGYDVLLIEDILDSGNTLSYVRSLLATRGAKSVKICTLLDKPDGRIPGITIKADYIGFEIPNEFVVGYGLDYNEKYRNLPFVGILKPEVYE